MNIKVIPPRPALLVSIHDVSPLTIEPSRRAVALALSAGVPASALTLLVIPRHEDRVPLNESVETRDWVRNLVDAGACLCMHGLTHQMAGRVNSPWKWAWAWGFARGQGELYITSTVDCESRIEIARDIFRRVGLESDICGFVPPAWLLSPESLLALERAGFSFYERLTGIVHRDTFRARRLIGFGSLTAIEAHLTAGYARLQSCFPPADTRLAIHPVDVGRASTFKAIQSCLRRLLENLEPMNYADFLLREI